MLEAAVIGVETEIILKRSIGLGVGEAEIQRPVQTVPESILDRCNADNIGQLDLDDPRVADDLQMLGIIRGIKGSGIKGSEHLKPFAAALDH